MKLIIAIVHDRKKHRLSDALLDNGFTFTQLGSTGGFLRQGNLTVLIGVEEAEVARVMEIIQTACATSERYVNVPGQSAPGALSMLDVSPPHPMKVETGGAVAFVLDVESFHRF